MGENPRALVTPPVTPRVHEHMGIRSATHPSYYGPRQPQYPVSPTTLSDGVGR